MLQAWARVTSRCTLPVIGDGPLLNEIRSSISRTFFSAVRLDERLPREASLKVLQDARVLILPSNCYVDCLMTIADRKYEILMQIYQLVNHEPCPAQ